MRHVYYIAIICYMCIYTICILIIHHVLLFPSLEIGSSVVSVCPKHLTEASDESQDKSKGKASATKYVLVVRCQSQEEKRLVLMLRPLEGVAGEVSVTVVADTQPKAAKVRHSAPIYPLSFL